MTRDCVGRFVLNCVVDVELHPTLYTNWLATVLVEFEYGECQVGSVCTFIATVSVFLHSKGVTV